MVLTLRKGPLCAFAFDTGQIDGTNTQPLVLLCAADGDTSSCVGEPTDFPNGDSAALTLDFERVVVGE